jgi:glycosyltransferase involved in cell wall biosynthesis
MVMGKYSNNLEGNTTYTAYIPHGVSQHYKPIPWDSTDIGEMKIMRTTLGISDKEFVILFNNRNIRRKQPGDVILAYKEFCDGLSKEESDKCVLLLHTQPIDNNGTDLVAVISMLCPDYDVVFTNTKYNTNQLNMLYNISDVTLNISSNEGFGLATAESVAAGTPIIVNVTGGLQDQCGFSINGKYLTELDYVSKPSLHDVKNLPQNLSWGNWVKPVWPSNRSLQGSPPTPYIFDDRCSYSDVAKAIRQWFDTDVDLRIEFGKEGSEYVKSKEVGMIGEHMGDRFINAMDKVLKNWRPKKGITIWKI